MVQNIAIENMSNEVTNANEIQQLNNNNIEIEEVKMTTAETKSQTVEEARQKLAKAKSVLEANKDAEANIKKSAEVNIKKAETAYLEALKKVEKPTTQVEFWEVTEETKEKMSITKRKAEIIIATSDYSMAVAKTNIELGKQLITNDKLEKLPLFVTDAKLFYDADIQLKDLNGNMVEKGTPNVYVPIDTANGHWIWATYHEYNLNAIIKEGTPLTIENVVIKEFTSVQEFAQYRGVNNVLSRGFNGLEKAGNAALATQHEFFKTVFQKAFELKTNVSVVTKYYNLGKTLNLKVWNSATLGVVAEDFPKYDLTIGDKIIATLTNKGFSDKVIKSRYLIDAISKLAKRTIEGQENSIGIDKTIAVLNSLSTEDINAICKLYFNQMEDIYHILLKNYEAKEEKQTA